MGRKYGLDRHRPSGDWVQTTLAVSVVGVQHRKAAAEAFAKAARKAEAKGLQYGIQLEHQPNNPHDRNAIAVYGVADRKGWFVSGLKEWQIGYLDRDLAAEIVEDLVSKNLAVGAELYSIYEGSDGYLDFKVIVLAPPGMGQKVRRRSRGLKTIPDDAE